MARRRQRMRGLGRCEYSARDALRTLFYRFENADPYSMTRNECLELFAPAEDIPILKQAPKVSKIGQFAPREFDIPWHYKTEYGQEHSFTLQVRFAGSKADHPLIPLHPKWQREVPELNEWLWRRVELRKKFGVAWALLEHMDHRLRGPADVKYYLPTFSILMGVSQFGEDFEYAFNGQRKGSPPALTVPVRQACRDTAQLLTSAALMPENNPLKTAVTIDFKSFFFTVEGFGQISSFY